MTKVDMDEMHAIQRKIIRMLKNKRKFGGAHTQTLNLKNCVPKHIRGEKVVDEAIKDLFKRGILMNKMSTGEKHCSLNPKRLKEIGEIENN
jgi:hypothetical protein